MAASPGSALCVSLTLVLLLLDVSHSTKYIRIIEDGSHEFECEMNSAYARTASFSVEVAEGTTATDAVLTKEHLGLCRRNITELSLEGAVSKITADAFEATPLLEYFEIEGSNIVELKPDQFRNLQNIREFEFTLPALPKMGDGVLSNAAYVTVNSGSANYITAGVFSGGRIRELVLEGGFSALPPGSFSDMARLTKLEIKNSSLGEFSGRLLLSGSENVDELALRNNRITSLDADSFYGLRRLELLDLTGNQIGELGTDIFATNSKLFQVLLADNRIAYIGDETFSTVPLLNLNVLDLDFNHLNFIEVGAFRQFPELKGVTVVGNPFKCNCLDELRRWLVENNVQEISCEKFYDGKHPACVAAKRGDAACAPSATDGTDYLRLYRGQFQPQDIADLATGCQSEIYVFSKNL